MVTASLLFTLAGPTLGGRGLIPAAAAQTAPPTTPDPVKPDGAPQPSQEEVAAARQHFESGVDFFQRGNYSAARLEFEAAYQLTKYPQLLYNLGKTAEKLNQDADAIKYLEGYLAASPSASDADEVRTKLIELRQRAPQTTPVVATTPPPPAPSKLPPIPALILMGGGAGILIAGIGCGAGALSSAGSIQPGNVPAGTYLQGDTLNKAAIALDVIGGLALAAGGAWTGYWLYKRHQANKPPAKAVSLIPTGLGIGVVGSF